MRLKLFLLDFASCRILVGFGGAASYPLCSLVMNMFPNNAVFIFGLMEVSVTMGGLLGMHLLKNQHQ